ncbi:oligosaccharide flippase family protein [candidate division KSB1 bacterium]|nr:oligosaccharide flippase family protein [candidate division KSB1 bacterium]
MTDQTTNIKKNAQYIFIQKMTVPVINLLVTIYIVKKLSISDYGIYNLLLAIIGYLTLFSSMGMLNVFQRYVPEYNTTEEFYILKKLFRSGILLRLLLTVLCLALIWLFKDQVNHLLKVENFNVYVEYFAIGIILFLEIQIVEVTLSSLLLNKYILLSYMVSAVIRAVLIYLFLERGMGIKGLLLAETINYATLLVMQLIYYYSGYARFHDSDRKPFPLRRILKYAGFSYLDEVGETILDVKTDFFIISSFLGPSMVGLYAFANQIIELVSKILPFKFLKSLIRPVFFSNFTKNQDGENLNANFNFLLKIIAFISLPTFVCLFLLSDKIILYLFDEKYLPALNVLIVFTTFMIINSFQFPLQLVVQAKEKVKITFTSKIFSIYNLIGDILIINFMGIVGVGLITCTARLFQNIYIYFKIRKYVPLTIETYPFLKITFNSVLLALPVYFLRTMATNVYTLLIVIILSILIYLLISFFNKTFLDEERELINKMLPKPIFVF